MSKVIYTVVAVALAGFVGLLFWARTAPQPSTLGVRDGQLAACPSSPNCVSSQATLAQNQIAPLTFSGDALAAMERLERAIGTLPRSTIVTDSADYIHAEFRTALIGYIDDLECVLDANEGVIHVRSASRLGHSDLGANRKRIELLRTAFTKTIENDAAISGDSN